MDGATAPKATFDPQALAQAPAALRAAIEGGDLAGAVTLIWREGEIAQVETMGRRDVETGAPMTRDTLFRIASMTKPVTSVAALMLMEEGKLTLTDPITKWAPEFADMRVLKSAAGPLEETYPAPRDITIEDLLTHRAGLAYGFTSRGPDRAGPRRGARRRHERAPDRRRLDEGPGRPAALLSAGRAFPLQPRDRRAGLFDRPGSREWIFATWR